MCISIKIRLSCTITCINHFSVTFAIETGGQYVKLSINFSSPPPQTLCPPRQSPPKEVSHLHILKSVPLNQVSPVQKIWLLAALLKPLLIELLVQSKFRKLFFTHIGFLVSLIQISPYYSLPTQIGLFLNNFSTLFPMYCFLLNTSAHVVTIYNSTSKLFKHKTMARVRTALREHKQLTPCISRASLLKLGRQITYYKPARKHSNYLRIPSNKTHVKNTTILRKFVLGIEITVALCAEVLLNSCRRLYPCPLAHYGTL